MQRFVWISGIVFATSSCFCKAAALQATPTALTISQDSKSTTVILQNNGDTPLNAQARVMAWQQENNSDQLLPTEDVFTSPPILNIPPHGKQVVRIVVPAAKKQMDYRVLIDELPSNQANRSATAVEVLVRYSIPLLIEREGNLSAQPRLVWKWIAKGDELDVTVRNEGERRAQLADLSVERAGRSVATKPGLVGYVLGGAKRSWKLKFKGDTPETLTARVNGYPVTVKPDPEK